MSASGWTTCSEPPRREQRPYQPYGSGRELMQRRAEEIVLSGPAGTGKSRACLEKLHLLALKYPGMRGLILRKTRESLTESALVTFEQRVLPAGSALSSNALRRVRQSYRYPNGSEIVVGGLDKPSRVMSTEYDAIYVQEAIELIEGEWEALTTRLRAGAVPYQQLFGDTNPDTPIHWLYQRAQIGKTLLLESRHEENPTIWDQARQQPTPFGETYLARLDRLTGVRYKRLRLGLWVAAEGQVYEGYDPAAHRVDQFEIPREWARYWVVDFGYTHPFVWQAWAKDPDGRLFRYREIYHTGRLVEDHARQIRAVTEGEPLPVAVICDHDAEDRATLEKYLKLATVPAYKAVSPGIQAVSTRLRDPGDGRVRLAFLRDSLVERDTELAEARKPCCSEEEVPGYVWNVSAGRRKGEEPVKQDDHGMDCTRYVVAYVDRIGEEEPNPLWGMGLAEGISGWQPR